MRVAGEHRFDTGRWRVYDVLRAHRRVHLRHLGGQASPQVAARSLHYAEVADHVEGSLGAGGVAVTNSREEELEIDAGADDQSWRQDPLKARPALIVRKRVIRDEERPPVEVDSSRQAAPPHDDPEVACVVELWPDLRRIRRTAADALESLGGITGHVEQESTAAFQGVPTICNLEGTFHSLESLRMAARQSLHIEKTHLIA